MTDWRNDHAQDHRHRDWGSRVMRKKKQFLYFFGRQNFLERKKIWRFYWYGQLMFQLIVGSLVSDTAYSLNPTPEKFKTIPALCKLGLLDDGAFK